MKIDFKGMDEVGLSFKELANTPDDVKREMVQAGSEVLIRAERRMITALGMVKTGQLRDSIAAKEKKKKDTSDITYTVYPKGNRKKVGKEKKAATNAEVGFIHEYGLPSKNIAAKQWMAKAVKEATDDVVDAEMAIYDRYLKSLNL